MLLKDFYKVNSLESTEGKAIAYITINKDHDVFKGHFPGNPVTPGVCMMQIIKELSEEVLSKKLFMESASNVKFMAIINPYKTPDLELTLDIDETETGFRVKNITKFNDTVALKLTTSYNVI
ncbi:MULTISPECIES: 3-hydroxyacyl-ACP dehydratase [Bizionia]|uniref:3-hydroxyacyl-ACP dehydratase n=1 Tax=Bizionia algoritergicola TaxID=291187 RepID=A0A5D0R3Y3_9FLAO|nr:MULTISPECIES: 3-hydroxyacyl-ACP dehydratase [Bizionia]OBX24363.1 3-hydroxyacyl-ACP dehydratase [Bizionia sp. APA-3]TYB75284.1 3-hydroxyacyl-ACP dehydratase [Bizionia algoritergicola]